MKRSFLRLLLMLPLFFNACGNGSAGSSTPTNEINETATEIPTPVNTTETEVETTSTTENTEDNETTNTAQSSVSTGYVLFSTMGSDTTYLINNDKEVVHTWVSDYGAANASYVIGENHLLRGAKVVSKDNTFANGGAVGGRIEELDFVGNTVWSFDHYSDDYILHHDMKELPSGNILSLSWDLQEHNGVEYWDEKIIEIDKDSQAIIWSWSAYEHSIVPTDNKADYIHLNSIDYKEDTILVSSRTLNELWTIEKSTGTIRQRYSGDLSGQHDATFLDNGNVLVFNNQRISSSVEEINLDEEKVVWRYDEGFFSDHISGAQRLSSGNTLICSGVDGEFIEVTNSGEVVWEYTNPYFNTTPKSDSNSVFKIRKYDINL